MGAATWTPERETGVEVAGRLIRSEFPALAEAASASRSRKAGTTPPSSCTPRVGQIWCFRFPRRAIALAGVRRELAWLPQLAPLLPLPIPVPEFQGAGAWSLRPTPGTSADGRSGARRCWPATNSPSPLLRRTSGSCWPRQLGTFLRVLHEPAPGRIQHRRGCRAAARPGEPRQPCAARGKHRGLPRPATRRAVWRRRSTRRSALIDASRRNCRLRAAPGVICHGDLHVRHVLVGPPDRPSPQVTGIIDWGDLCLADPAVDLSIAFGASAAPHARPSSPRTGRSTPTASCGRELSRSR